VPLGCADSLEAVPGLVGKNAVLRAPCYEAVGHTNAWGNKVRDPTPSEAPTMPIVLFTRSW
jgi:hypothetical protein